MTTSTKREPTKNELFYRSHMQGFPGIKNKYNARISIDDCDRCGDWTQPQIQEEIQDGKKSN